MLIFYIIVRLLSSIYLSRYLKNDAVYIIILYKMRVRLLSDIHLELSHNIKVEFKKQADVAILAGDIGNPFDDAYYHFLQKNIPNP